MASLSFGTFVIFAYGTLSETLRLLFEAVAAFVAVGVLSSMIFWMAARGKSIREKTEKRVEAITSKGTIIGLISLGFIVVFREGFETVLFLTPFLLDDMIATLVGVSVGILTAIIFAYSVFALGMTINLQRFFYFTSVMLILLAGGLAGYGVHELLEYFEQIGFATGWLAKAAYDLNISATSPFHQKGAIGSVFAVMFGYTVSAEWLRVIVHAIYLAVMLPLVIRIYRKVDRKE